MMNRFGDIDLSFKKLPPIYGFRSQNLVSIDKALEPIQSQIPELSYYINTAKKNCHYPNKYGLSKDQAACIYIYTMEWDETSLYRVLNKALRSENRQALKIWFPYLKLFDTALDLLPTTKEPVWRGIPVDIGNTFTKNQKVTWWPISSCSSSVNVIKQFLGNTNHSTIFLIEVFNGKKVSGFTEFENEDEVILRIGTELQVKAHPLKQADGSSIVHLIEINDTDENHTEPITTVGTHFPRMQLTPNLKWKPYAKTIAGGSRNWDRLNQLRCPFGIYIDDQQQSIYIADRLNNRIVKWKLGESNNDNGQIIAGGNGEGYRIDQLNRPTDMTLDYDRKSLIICDKENRRVVRWSLDDQQNDKQILISNIKCWGLIMTENGDLFVSDKEKHEVRKWKKGEREGKIVAGGHGYGCQLNQLNEPTYIFVDRQETVYVSDYKNHRVMKWIKDAREGIVVAGGHSRGIELNQLSYPEGLVVNEIGDVYIADCYNHRIMCWPSGSKEGRIVVGGNGFGDGLNQFKCPTGLTFDAENNLYVADRDNNRIQQFEVIKQ